MIHVDLNDYDLAGCGFLECAALLLTPSGVTWNNQAGGTACNQMQAQGVLVAFDPPPAFDDGMRFLTDRVGLTPALADAFDAACRGLGLPFAADRDPASLLRSQEAWVVCRVTRAGLPAGDPGPVVLRGVPDGTPCVLVWVNSD